MRTDADHPTAVRDPAIELLLHPHGHFDGRLRARFCDLCLIGASLAGCVQGVSPGCGSAGGDPHGARSRSDSTDRPIDPILYWFSGATESSRIGAREARAGKPSLLVIGIGGSTRSKGEKFDGVKSRATGSPTADEDAQQTQSQPGARLAPQGATFRGLRRGVAAVTGLFMAFPLVWCASPSWASASTNGTTPWPGGTWQPDPAKYAMAVVQSVPLKMNDGVTLIANVGYPADSSTGTRVAGTFPVLLTQDPYPSEDQPNPFYVTRGYINAVVEVRGTIDTYGPGGKQVVSSNFGPRQTKDGVARCTGQRRSCPVPMASSVWTVARFWGSTRFSPQPLLGRTRPSKRSFRHALRTTTTRILPVASQSGRGLFSSPLAETLEGTKNEAANHAASVALEHQFLTGGPAAYNGTYWQERSTYNVAANVVKNKIPRSFGAGGIRPTAPDHFSSMRFFRTPSTTGLPSAR